MDPRSSDSRTITSSSSLFALIFVVIANLWSSLKMLRIVLQFYTPWIIVLLYIVFYDYTHGCCISFIGTAGSKGNRVPLLHLNKSTSSLQWEIYKTITAQCLGNSPLSNLQWKYPTMFEQVGFIVRYQLWGHLSAPTINLYGPQAECRACNSLKFTTMPPLQPKHTNGLH